MGQIADYRFTKDQKKVEVDVIINKAYSHFVKKDSHFWNISGIDANLGLLGINIQADSLNAIVQGLLHLILQEKVLELKIMHTIRYMKIFKLLKEVRKSTLLFLM